MKSQRVNIRFAILFPLASLAVWYFLVPAQIGLAWLNLHNLASHSTDGSAHLPYLAVPNDHLLSFAIMSVGMAEGDTIAALDMPGVFIYSVASLPFAGTDLWHPAALPAEAWRSFCAPFFCLPAWWFVGRGLDNLIGWSRSRWWTLLIGTLLCAAFLTFLLGLTFGQSPEERASDKFMLWGFAFWTLAFAVFPAAWIHLWFTKRKSRAETIKVSI